jgi:hypothetical protein
VDPILFLSLLTPQVIDSPLLVGAISPASIEHDLSAEASAKAEHEDEH